MATFIFPSTPVSIPGVATEATLLLVETNTADTVTELQTLNAKDFATETTLSAIAAVDFATESTLSAVATEATLNSIDSKISVVDTGNVSINSSVLPTGAATESTLATLATEATLSAVATESTLQSIEANVATESSLQKLTNKDVVHALYVDYSTTNLPGNATNPLELVASAGSQIAGVTVFDTSGVPCEIMIGAAASETRKVVFGPGADTTIPVQITTGTRISVRRLDAAGAVSVGDLTINFIS